jgi:hypothetical protein
VGASAVSDRELRLLRLRSQGLLPGSGANSVAEATAGALVIQGQDVAAAALGLRSRTGLTEAEVRAQAGRRSLCRAWLMRNTIFLFATRDFAWMRPLLAERAMLAARRRLPQLGVDERRLRRVLRTLADRLERGPLPRREATEMIKAAGITRSDDGNALYWVVHCAALTGVLVVRPALERVQTFVVAPADKPLSREEGLGRLARRYLKAHGPAAPADLANWGKMKVGDARTAFEHAGRLREVETSQGPLAAIPGSLDPPESGEPVVRLLSAWDHWLLGWRDRALTVPEEVAKGARDPFDFLTRAATVDGVLFGLWRLERDGAKLTVVVEPFDRISRAVRAGLEQEATDIGRFYEADATLRVAG